MKKHIALYAIIAAALIAAPVSLRAQDQQAKKSEATENGAPAAKKHRHLPFHGKVAAVDTGAMTVKVGHMVISITPETKIIKDGKPATLSDITVGEKISGSYLKSEGGKLNASKIRIGGKAKAKGKRKKENGADKN